MRTLAVIAMMGIIAAAQTPTPPPAGPKPELPKQASLDPDKMEKLELRMALAESTKQLAIKTINESERTKSETQAAYTALIAQTCAMLGGKSEHDCDPLERVPGKPQVIQLKLAVVAKGELKK